MIRVYASSCDNITVYNVHRDETGCQFVNGKILATFQIKQDAISYAEKLIDEEILLSKKKKGK